MTPLDRDDAPALGHIVHPTDLTVLSEIAFAHALRLALAFEGHLGIVHAASPAADEEPDWAAFPGVRALLARWGLLDPEAPRAAVAERLGLRVSKTDIPVADPLRALERFFEENRCDLLVLATHAREGLARLLHGSIAEAMARWAQVPTLFLPPEGRGFVDAETGAVRLADILLPVHVATPPHEAAALALKMADALGHEHARLHLLHVGPAEAAPAVSVDPRHARNLRRIAADGAVVPAIVEAAARIDADLIVMATHGHDGPLDALRGSTTEQVLRQAGRALLAVPVV